MGSWIFGRRQAGKDPQFSGKNVRVGFVNCPGAGWGGHDQFFAVRPGEMLLATVTGRGSVRHLAGYQAG